MLKSTAAILLPSQVLIHPLVSVRVPQAGIRAVLVVLFTRDERLTFIVAAGLAATVSVSRVRVVLREEGFPDAL